MMESSTFAELMLVGSFPTVASRSMASFEG
jgi:hypothetical protein